MRDNDVCLFTAAERMKGRMMVFCEQGRIKAGDKSNPFCMLFEDMITQIVVNKNRELSSFHPKVWVVEYANPQTKEQKWRLLVLSRNLTFDTSWDVAVRLDGEPTDVVQKGTAPIVDFLRYLGRQASNDNADAHSSIVKMANRLKKVRFDTTSSDFDEFEFIPIGPGLTKIKDHPLFTTNYDNAIIVSPFVSETGPLEIFAINRTTYGDRYGEFALVARDYQLAKLSEKTRVNYSLYMPDPCLNSVDLDDLEEGSSSAQYADLHAKMYFTDVNSNRNLYVGSLNASYNGMHNNVECLIRLHAKNRKVIFRDLMKSFVDPDGKDRGPFLKVESDSLFQQSFEDEEDTNADIALRSFSKQIDFSKVDISKENDDTYAINCSFEIVTQSRFLRASQTHFGL